MLPKGPALKISVPVWIKPGGGVGDCRINWELGTERYAWSVLFIAL